MSLEEHLSRATEAGTYDSAGVFTLDRAKALEKLAGFTLEHWIQVLYLLGAWFYRDGDGPIDFELQPGSLTIRRPVTTLTTEQVEHLEDYVLTDAAFAGVSKLALARHVWLSGGSFSLEAGGLRCIWEKDKVRVESASSTEGVLVQLSHKVITGDPTELVEFLGLTFAWAPYRWSFNGLPMAPISASGKSIMQYNAPKLASSVMPGISIGRPDQDFQLHCQWQSHGETVVVVDGLAYPLKQPLLQGLRCVVFCQNVQRNLTQSDIVVSVAQRKEWGDALQQMIQGFTDKAHFWNNKEFMLAYSEVFCRALWSSFDYPSCFNAAQRLAALCTRERFTPFLLARAAIRRGDFVGALYCLRPLATWKLNYEERTYADDVDREFAERLPDFALCPDELEAQVSEMDVCVELGPILPESVHAFCFKLAALARKLGRISHAEKLYFASYFVPRGLKSNWSTFLNVHSFMDMGRNRLPIWLGDLDLSPNFLDGVWAAIDLAQLRQSTQRQPLERLSDRFRHTRDHVLLKKLNLRRMEAWRLERLTSQAEWFKWHLVTPLENLAPRYAPAYYDESYAVPNYFTGEGLEARLTTLRCHTVYLEYAALSYHRALAHGQETEIKRFGALVGAACQLFDQYEERDHAQELVELARIAIELKRSEQAANLLQRAVCKYPPGDFSRLPLLVDMAILEPHRAHSVVNGLFKVLNLNEQFAGPLDRLVHDCAWPFPFELPSRLRRLSWELEGKEALRVLRLARVLYRKAFGPSWMETTEQDWVADAVEVLTRKVQ